MKQTPMKSPSRKINRTNTLLSSIAEFVKKASTAQLSSIIGTIGFAFLILGAWVINSFYTKEYPLVLGTTITGVATFLWGWMGVVWAYRQEAPYLVTIRGRPAVIAGVIFSTICWGVTLFLIGSLITSLLPV